MSGFCECGRPATVKGYCRTHYKREWRRANPRPQIISDHRCECGCGQYTRLAPLTSSEKGWRKGEPLRFITGHNTFAQRHKGYVVEDRGYGTPCWVWQGRPSETGYGRICVNRQRHPAHRFFYERARGPVAPGQQIDHLCRIPLCVNPDHLEAVTAAENTRRSRKAKLSARAAAEIRAYRDEFFARHPFNSRGEPRKRFPQGEVPKLAAKYGVRPLTITAVLSGETWR